MKNAWLPLIRTNHLTSAKGSIGLVLAHPQPFFLHGMKNFLERQDRLRILSCCTKADDTLDTVEHLVPDILVMDIAMQPHRGPAMQEAVAERGLSTRIIAIATHATCSLAGEAVAAGVSGIVLADDAPEQLVKCIRTVTGGGHHIPAETVDSLRDAKTLAMRMLSPREQEVATLVSKGLPNKEVSKELGITEGTVKVHLHNIFKKLEISNRLSLILLSNSSNFE